MIHVALLPWLLASASVAAEVRLERWSVMPVHAAAIAATGEAGAAAGFDPETSLSAGQVLEVVLVIENTGEALEPGALVLTEPLVDDLRYIAGSAAVTAGPAARFLVSTDGSHFSEPQQSEPPGRFLRWVWQEPVAEGLRIELRYRVRVP